MAYKYTFNEEDLMKATNRGFWWGMLGGIVAGAVGMFIMLLTVAQYLGIE